MAAAPFGLLLIGVALLAVVGGLPRRVAVHPSIPIAVVVAEWVFELHRFHIIG